MDQRSTWGDSVASKKDPKLPFRGYQKITDDMDDPQRRGAEIWNEMVARLIKAGEMKDK